MERCEGTSKNPNKRKRNITKRTITKIHRENYIYITSKSDFKRQIEQCKELFFKGYNEIYLHCLGKAINQGINLALKIIENSTNILDFEVNTSTVEIFDDLHPLSNDDDFETQKRLNSCLHIRIFKTIRTSECSE